MTIPTSDIQWMTFRLKDGSEIKVVWSSIESMHVQLRDDRSIRYEMTD